MKITPVVNILKTIPNVRHIGGASEFSTVVETGAKASPSLYVYPLGNMASENNSTGIAQKINHQFAVAIYVRDYRDDKGTAAFDALHDIEIEIFKALLGADIEPRSDAITYSGGELLNFAGGGLFWQLKFNMATYLRS